MFEDSCCPFTHGCKNIRVIWSTKPQKCPFCDKFQVKRIASGIWFCKKCDVRFTAGAYTVGKKSVLAEEAATEVTIEAPKSEEA